MPLYLRNKQGYAEFFRGEGMILQGQDDRMKLAGLGLRLTPDGMPPMNDYFFFVLNTKDILILNSFGGILGNAGVEIEVRRPINMGRGFPPDDEIIDTRICVIGEVKVRAGHTRFEVFFISFKQCAR